MIELIRRDYRNAAFRSATPTATVPAQFDNQGSGQGLVPFRRATQEKMVQLTQESFTAATTLTRINRTIEGNGYIYGIVLDVQGVTAANTAATVFTEDAPWNGLDTVVLADTAGELVRLPGWDLLVANLASSQYDVTYQGAEDAVLFQATQGTGIPAGGTGSAIGGTFRFVVRVPVGLNRRSLSGVVGNQDRGTRYQLRTDFAASSSMYLTAPSTLAPVTIDKYYEYYTLPSPQSNRGERQQQVPDDYGKLHFITSTDFANAPAASSTINHYLIRIGNTIRFVAIVVRYGTGNNQRQLAEQSTPSAITFKIGDDLVFQDTWRYRRWCMGERYGANAFPAGVLVYDAMHDLMQGAGNEIGDDYWFTQGLNNAQFIITYPSGASAGTLHSITDDLQEVASA